jgi:hypothetical protein
MTKKNQKKRVANISKTQDSWSKGIKTAATKPKTQKSKAGAELTGAIK